MRDQNDLDFATEYAAAIKQGPPKSTKTFLFVVVLMFATFIGWAAWAKLDEVTRGDGRVIPSGKNQGVQSLEGGIVKEILAHTGDTVEKGDILLRIDDTSFSSNLGELRAKEISLSAQIARLTFELHGAKEAELIFPAEIVKRAPATVDMQRQLYGARRKSLETQINVLNERLEQKKRQLNELETTLDRLRKNLKLALEEKKIKEPLAKRGIVPRTEMLKLKREVVDLEGQIQLSEQTRPRLHAAIREAQSLVQEQRLKFQQDAQVELSDKSAELAVVRETIRAAQDRVVRADVRAPVDGIVNKVNINTVGGVVKAGEVLVEIVPREESLLIEARIPPKDIAFVHLGQPALVKITAYDFSIYGGLEGVVEEISADSSIDEVTRDVFYTVKIKTLSNRLGGNKNNLDIIPGMVASVDILTGKKSVLDYLLKPINKARTEALRER